MSATTLPARGTDVVPRWIHPVEPARRPEEAAVQETLARIRAWNPYDGDAWLDDVGDVLDTVAPPEERVEELGEQLRGHLMQLVGIATTYDAEDQDPRAAERIRHARQAIEAEMPGDYQPAVSHLRRMGWGAHELLELLVDIECVKKPDSLNEDQ